MPLLFAEVWDKLTPLNEQFVWSFAWTAVALLLGKWARWLLVPFILISGICTIAAILEPWSDANFWAAVRVERGPFYHPWYVMTSLLPFVLLGGAFLRKRQPGSRRVPELASKPWTADPT